MEIKVLIDHKRDRQLWVGFIAPRLLIFIHADSEKAHAEHICDRAKNAGMNLGPIDKEVVQEALSYLTTVGWTASVPREKAKGPNLYKLTQDGAAELSRMYICNQPGSSVGIV